MEKLTLAEVQSKSFEILLKIKEICDKHNWKYFLLYGTLIGAIRHDGFIPWDDDIDIGMMREDYDAFVNYCIENEESLKPFQLFHYKNNDKYIYPIARFSDSRYELEFLKTKQYGLGLFIDIYPFDNFNPDDKVFIKKQISIYNHIVYNGMNCLLPVSSNLVKAILKMPKFAISKLFNRDIHKKLIEIENRAIKHSNENVNSEYVECVTWTRGYWHFKKEWFAKLELHKFNGQDFLIPGGYDQFLKEVYGDYMKLPPEEKRVAHHEYNAYKK